MNEQPALKIGHVVLISEDKVSRGKWPMGRIDKLLPGKDGLIRTVILKTRRALLRRPVQRLHRLEARSTQIVSGEFGDSGAYGRESASRKVKKKTKKKQVTQKRVSSLQQYWRGGEDVRARTRCGRTSRPPVRLDL